MNWPWRRSPSTNNVKQMFWGGGGGGTSAVGIVDPTTWHEAFQSHWLQAYAILQQNPSPTNVEQVTAVTRHLDQMVLLLLTEVNSSPEPTIGPIMDYLFTENILEKVTLWMSFADNVDVDLSIFCKRNMLKLYEGILNQSQQILLVHKPILTPILQLLEDCSQMTTPRDYEIEKLFVLLLNQIVVKITDKEQSPLLEFFFRPDLTDEGPPKFLVFSLLIPFLYDEGNVGQLARDALLLILAVSRRVESVGRFVAEHSTFCPVLATGLSALYSSLPRRLTAETDDWHRITSQNIEANAELQSFYNALEFCNAVIQVAHKLVVDQLLDYIYQGFLVPVMGASLLENSSEELVLSTAYLELFFRTVTETPFMRTLLKFLISEHYDGVTLLETLVTRISSNSRLCIVSLALFETLLNLHCEDLIFELILKYLVPCTHLMISQASHVTDVGHYGRSAEKFLSLIPRCCATLLVNANDHLSSASSAGSLEAIEDYFSKDDHRPPTGGAADARSRSSSSSGAASGPIVVHTSSNATNNEIVYEYDAEGSVKPLEIGYLEYLMDARCRVQYSMDACRCWSLQYDGKTPDPKLFRNLESSSSSSSCSSSAGSGTGVLMTNVILLATTNNENKTLTSDDGSATVVAEGGGAPSLNSDDAADLDRCEDFEDDNQSLTAFQRQASFRKSKSNRYSIVRHSSLLVNTGRPQLNNLALGDDDYGSQLAANGDVENEFLRRNSATGSTPDSGPSSTMSTPRYRKDVMSASMPVDYFKISYDDESLFAGMSDSQEESSDSASVLLRGWSQIQDASAFLEILNRVKVSHAIRDKTLDDTLGYITGVFDMTSSSHRTNGDGDDDESTSTAAKGANSDLAQSKDSGFDQQDEGDEKSEDLLNVQLRNIPKSSFSSPDIGPFLSILLHKLENMLQNSLFTNLHLTGVIAKLACYPQPLITSFLLNTNLVFQPSIRSLHQVLSALRHKVDAYACSVDNFESLLIRGQKFLYQRDKRYQSERRRSRGAFLKVAAADDEDSSSLHNGTTSPSGKHHASHKYGDKKTGLTQFFNLQSSGNRSRGDGGGAGHKRRSESLGSNGSRTSSYKFQHQHRKAHDSPDANLESMKTKNVVYCAVVLEEFLKELAAIAQEHSVRHV